MKKLLLLLPVVILLAACGEKDKDYYLKNTDKAKEKLESCSMSMFSRDKSVENDKECNAADEALKEHRRVEHEKQIAERKRIKQEEEAKKREDVEKEKANLTSQYGSLTWRENVSNYANNPCSTYSPFENEANSATCIAWKEFYNSQKDIGKNELNQLTITEMQEKLEDYCKLDRRTISPCAVFSVAYTEKSEEAVNEYVKNPELLRTAYNKCVDDKKDISKSKYSYVDKNTLQSNLRASHPCKQAKEAKQKLNLGYDDFDRKIGN